MDSVTSFESQNIRFISQANKKRKQPKISVEVHKSKHMKIFNKEDE